MSYVYDPYGELVDRELDGLDFTIPLDDQECWTHYPQYRWMMNKLALCDAQGIAAFPHGFEPGNFPVFSKPVINPQGLAHGTKVIEKIEDYQYQAGHFWMSYLEGPQYSVDVVFIGGLILDIIPVQLVENRNGPVLWTLRSELPEDIEGSIRSFAKKHIKDYTGVFNFEVIGKVITEAVPRVSCQWIDLYGERFLENLILLYRKELYTIEAKRVGWCSKIVRAPKEYGDKIPYIKDIGELDSLYRQVSSLYLPWEADKPLNNLPDDPNSFRIAVINGSYKDTMIVAPRVESLIQYKSLGL